MSVRENIPGIDFGNLVPWFNEHVAAVGDLDAAVIGHGRSNITYRVTAGEREWVLRRPPLSHVLPTAHDMAREFRVISALRDTKVPVPDAIALCEDREVIGAPFYIMSFVRGMIPTDAQTVQQQFDQPTLTRMGEELIDTLADLHSINPAAVGLGGLGKPEGFIARQVKRFGGQIEQSKVRRVPEFEELARRLAAAVPADAPGAIVHGDYRLDNCVIDDAGHIAAVLDWEMATLGDPLADLGMQVMYWADDAPGPANAPGISSSSVTALPGFLRRSDALRRYAARTWRDLSYLDFYAVLAYFKLGVILEGIHARFLEGGTVGAGFDTMGAQALTLARTGLAVADGSQIAALRG